MIVTTALKSKYLVKKQALNNTLYGCIKKSVSTLTEPATITPQMAFQGSFWAVVKYFIN